MYYIGRVCVLDQFVPILSLYCFFAIFVVIWATSLYAFLVACHCALYCFLVLQYL